MRQIITVQESIYINSSKEHVWSFTQNIENRSIWDKTVKDCKLLQKKPMKLIWLKMKGGIITKMKYKLCDRPNKTSLKMYDTHSFFVKGGGGSWNYIEEKNKTKWTQTNSVILKNRTLFLLFGWIIKITLKKNTIAGMKRAKHLIENTSYQ